MSILKLFHVLFIFTWIGTLFSLSRLMAYHARQSEEVQLKCARLYRNFYLSVDLPSMLIALILAFNLLVVKDINWKAGWFHMKLMFGVLLVSCDLIVGYQIIKLCRKPIIKDRAYKVLHALVGLCLLGILVAIYVLKPNSR